MNELKKKYGLITAICMVAGIVIGSGVFFKATPVFKNNGGDMVKSLLTVLVVGILMTTCAYTFSILAGKHSKVNGLVDYAEAEVGGGLAYAVGWFISVPVFLERRIVGVSGAWGVVNKAVIRGFCVFVSYHGQDLLARGDTLLVKAREKHGDTARTRLGKKALRLP